MNQAIKDIRKDYKLKTLLEEDVLTNPVESVCFMVERSY